MYRLLADQLQIVAFRCGTLVFKEAREVTASSHKSEDTSMRNLAFSIMLTALALLQIALRNLQGMASALERPLSSKLRIHSAKSRSRMVSRKRACSSVLSPLLSANRYVQLT
jgi:hypothetical protein